VYLFSLVHCSPGPAFRKDVPYCVLLVELEEGPHMISLLTGDDLMACLSDRGHDPDPPRGLGRIIAAKELEVVSLHGGP
jgi:DUF35 OB-fold domain, acyl-CoA-associated